MCHVTVLQTLGKYIGGTPATQQVARGLESGDITATLQADGDADIEMASSESPTDTSGKEGDVSDNDSLTES